MATVRVTRTRDFRSAVSYSSKQSKAHDKSDPFIQDRVLALGCFNCSKFNYIKQMQLICTKNRTKLLNRVEMYRITQSFSNNELDPHKKSDWYKCNQMGMLLAKKLYPDKLFIVSTQADGKGHKLHNHIDVLNFGFRDNKALRSERTNQGYVAYNSDLICETNGISKPSNLPNLSEKQLMTKSKVSINKNSQNVARGSNSSFKAVLQQRIINVAARSEVTNFDKFVDVAKRFKLDVSIRKNKKGKINGLSFNLLDSSRKRPVRANKLGKSFEKETLSELFDKHLRLQQQQNQQRIQRINTTNRIRTEERKRRDSYKNNKTSNNELEL